MFTLHNIFKRLFYNWISKLFRMVYIFFYTNRKCESELECWQKCIIMFYNEYNFCRHMCLITQNRRWEHTNILKTCSILHTILISSFFYDFALSNTSETWNIERILVFLYGTHITPIPTNFKIKTLPPFPEVALWRWVVNWDYWRVLLPSLPPLTCTDYSAFDLCVHLHFLESMQIVERPIWNGVDPIVGEIPTKKRRKFHSLEMHR